jgi:hypothetical protein
MRSLKLWSENTTLGIANIHFTAHLAASMTIRAISNATTLGYPISANVCAKSDTNPATAIAFQYLTHVVPPFLILQVIVEDRLWKMPRKFVDWRTSVEFPDRQALIISPTTA